VSSTAFAFYRLALKSFTRLVTPITHLEEASPGFDLIGNRKRNGVKPMFNAHQQSLSLQSQSHPYDSTTSTERRSKQSRTRFHSATKKDNLSPSISCKRKALFVKVTPYCLFTTQSESLPEQTKAKV